MRRGQVPRHHYASAQCEMCTGSGRCTKRAQPDLLPQRIQRHPSTNFFVDTLRQASYIGAHWQLFCQGNALMPQNQPPRPTDAELEILRVLWEHGPSTVREVLNVISHSRETGYTTVLK